MKKAISCVGQVVTVADNVRTTLCATDIGATDHSGMSGMTARQAAWRSFRIFLRSCVMRAQNVVSVIRGDWTQDIVVNGVYS